MNKKVSRFMKNQRVATVLEVMEKFNTQLSDMKKTRFQLASWSASNKDQNDLVKWKWAHFQNRFFWELL